MSRIEIHSTLEKHISGHNNTEMELVSIAAIALDLKLYSAWKFQWINKILLKNLKWMSEICEAPFLIKLKYFNVLQ